MTMPDGATSIALTGVDTAFDLMHARLLKWGKCFLRGGAAIVDACREDIRRVNNKTGKEAEWQTTTTPYREMDPRFDRRHWSQPEIEAAGLLHNRVIALHPPRSLVLQVYYFEEDADILHTLPERIYDLTNWRGKPMGVNPRIERHNREKGDHVPLIVPEAFMAIRHRAIRELCARERGMPR